MDDETTRRIGELIRECANMNSVELFGSIALSTDENTEAAQKHWTDAADRSMALRLLWRLENMGLQLISATDDPGAYKRPMAGPRKPLP